MTTDAPARAAATPLAVRDVRATALLIAVNVAVFGVMLYVDGFDRVMGFHGLTLLAFGANSPVAVVGGGEVWRLFASTLVHVNILHVAFNMMALWQVGRMLEARWGAARVLGAYVVTGVVASAVSVGWMVVRARGTVGVSAGASGAIMGLIGATAMIGHLIGGDRGRLVRNAMLRWAGTILLLGAVGGLAGFAIDNAAHAGGLVSGALVALALERLGEPRRGAARDAISVAVFLSLAAGVFTLAWSRARADDSIYGLRDETLPQAEARLRRVLASHPRAAAAHYDLGIVLLRDGEAEAAAVQLTEAHQIEPADRLIHLALIHALSESDQPARTDEEARLLEAAHPGDADLRDEIAAAKRRAPRDPNTLPEKIRLR